MTIHERFQVQEWVREGVHALTPTRSRRGAFLLVVVLPTVVSFLYLLLFATSEYVTEFRFSVQSTTLNSNNAGSGGSVSTTAQSPVSSGKDASLYVSNYMVIDYLLSRQVVLDLQKETDLVAMFNNSKIDLLHRFWWNDGSPESLTRYWRNFIIDAWFDPTTGLASVKVNAYSPDDSLRIAAALVKLSERLVNQQMQRPRLDAIKFAEEGLNLAEQRLRTALDRERKFRTEHQSVDPALNGSATMALAATLQQNLAALRAQYSVLEKYLEPNAPNLLYLKSQIQSTEEQVANVSRQIGEGDISQGANTQGVSIAEAMNDYQSIQDERNIAMMNYNSMMLMLAQARTDALVQHAYLEPYVKPTIARAALYPRPLIGTILVFITALVIWGIGTLLYYSIRDHVA